MVVPDRFAGKVALITGSGRGIGKTIALRFAAEGADIVINYFRNRESAEQTAVEIRNVGRRVHVVRADVGTERLLEIDKLQILVKSCMPSIT